MGKIVNFASRRVIGSIVTPSSPSVAPSAAGEDFPEVASLEAHCAYLEKCILAAKRDAEERTSGILSLGALALILLGVSLFSATTGALGSSVFFQALLGVSTTMTAGFTLATYASLQSDVLKPLRNFELSLAFTDGHLKFICLWTE